MKRIVSLFLVVAMVVAVVGFMPPKQSVRADENISAVCVEMPKKSDMFDKYLKVTCDVPLDENRGTKGSNNGNKNDVPDVPLRRLTDIIEKEFSKYKPSGGGAGTDPFVKSDPFEKVSPGGNNVEFGKLAKALGALKNMYDSGKAVSQLADPSANPYKSHSSLAQMYDMLAATQAALGWVDFPLAEALAQALGIAKGTWDDPATRRAFLEWADNNGLVGALDVSADAVNDMLQKLFGMFYDKGDPRTNDDLKREIYDKRARFYAKMVAEGKEKEYEWLRDLLLATRPPKKGVAINPTNMSVKKPNVYLYPEKDEEITVEFEKPEKVTISIPDYSKGWTVLAKPDGTLIHEGDEYGYLFYECQADKRIYDMTQGFRISADNRDEEFRAILEAYGFNDQEIKDFIEFWSEYLDEDLDYIMCPLLTEGVDEAMPMTLSKTPDSIYRIWFGFTYDAGYDIETPAIEPIVREGFTVVEWGGSVID